MKNLLRYGVLGILAIILLLAAGCSGAATTQKESTPPLVAGSLESDAGKQKLTVYFAAKDANHVAPEIIFVPKTDNPAQVAIEHLLAGPKSAQLLAVATADVKLKRIWVKEHTAYLDFSDSLLKKAPGGSAYERLFVGAVVNTLTEFPNITSVRFLVEGKNIDTITGHLDLSEPVRRDEALIKRL